MPLPDLVIFDRDGVLADSEPISNEVLARVLSECGSSPSASPSSIDADAGAEPFDSLLELPGLLGLDR